MANSCSRSSCCFSLFCPLSISLSMVAPSLSYCFPFSLSLSLSMEAVDLWSNVFPPLPRALRPMSLLGVVIPEQLIDRPCCILCLSSWWSVWSIENIPQCRKQNQVYEQNLVLVSLASTKNEERSTNSIKSSLLGD